MEFLARVSLIYIGFVFHKRTPQLFGDLKAAKEMPGSGLKIKQQFSYGIVLGVALYEMSMYFH
jgi:hypothetical protein